MNTALAIIIIVLLIAIGIPIWIKGFDLKKKTKKIFDEQEADKYLANQVLNIAKIGRGYPSTKSIDVLPVVPTGPAPGSTPVIKQFDPREEAIKEAKERL